MANDAVSGDATVDGTALGALDETEIGLLRDEVAIGGEIDVDGVAATIEAPVVLDFDIYRDYYDIYGALSSKKL
jgi:hypothetical protein